MQVLHVNDTASQASMIRYYMREPYDQTVVATANMDPFRKSDLYDERRDGVPNYPHCSGKLAYFWRMLRGIRRAGIIHTHSIMSSKRHRPMIMRRMLAGRTFILHYHGGDIRITPYAVRRWFERNAAAVLVSTPDLLEYECAVRPVWLPTIVDPDLFADVRAARNGRGLCILKSNQTVSYTKKILNETGHGDIEWTFMRRPNNEPMPDDAATTRTYIPHFKMPLILSGYEYYADISAPDNTPADARSLTGIEAALVGCKVLDIHGNTYDRSIADMHLPGHVIPKLRDIYAGILES